MESSSWQFWTDGMLAGAYMLTASQHAQLALRRPDSPGHVWLVAACVGALAVNLSATSLSFFVDYMPLRLLNAAGIGLTTYGLVGFVQSMVQAPTAWIARLVLAAVSLMEVGIWTDIRSFYDLGLASIAAVLVSTCVLSFWRARTHDRALRLIALGFLFLSVALAADVLSTIYRYPSPSLAFIGFVSLFTLLSMATSERFTEVHAELDALRRDLEERVRLRTRVIARANEVLQRYLPAPLVERILSQSAPASAPKMERQLVTVLFADLCGFTAWAEERDPQKVAHVLNAWLETATQSISQTDGVLDKVMGDGLMALWGAPIPLSDQAQAQGAVVCGLDMLHQLQRLRDQWDEDTAGLHLRVGIHQAQVAVGNIGTIDRWSWTAVGAGVNTAARLEGAATPGTLLVSETLWSNLEADWRSERLRAGPPVAITLKGIRKPVPTRTVTAKSGS